MPKALGWMKFASAKGDWAPDTGGPQTILNYDDKTKIKFYNSQVTRKGIGRTLKFLDEFNGRRHNSRKYDFKDDHDNW